MHARLQCVRQAGEIQAGIAGKHRTPKGAIIGMGLQAGVFQRCPGGFFHRGQRIETVQSYEGQSKWFQMPSHMSELGLVPCTVNHLHENSPLPQG